MADARRILDETGLKSRQSAGVVYWLPYRDGVQITPVVWVQDVETLTAETACGSASVCVAIAQAAGHESNGVFRLPVYQPSGGVIGALVEFKDGLLCDAFIEGPVEILVEGELTYKGIFICVSWFRSAVFCIRSCSHLKGGVFAQNGRYDPDFVSVDAVFTEVIFAGEQNNVRPSARLRHR
jgi:hypothetical protein